MAFGLCIRTNKQTNKIKYMEKKKTIENLNYSSCSDWLAGDLVSGDVYSHINEPTTVYHYQGEEKKERTKKKEFGANKETR
jgi:hypothetical protein